MAPLLFSGGVYFYFFSLQPPNSGGRANHKWRHDCKFMSPLEIGYIGDHCGRDLGPSMYSNLEILYVSIVQASVYSERKQRSTPGGQIIEVPRGQLS